MTDSETPQCEHIWKKYKQTIKRYRTPSEELREHKANQMNPGHNGNQSLSATFVLMGCEKCHEKYYVDYKVN